MRECSERCWSSGSERGRKGTRLGVVVAGEALNALFRRAPRCIRICLWYTGKWVNDLSLLTDH